MMLPPPAALVCLDLQRGRLLASPHSERVADTCREVLGDARARGWPVLHVHRREAQFGHGKPIAGLEPLASEPVYVRPGPSAFSNEAFARQARALGGPLALIGFSLSDTVLATTFAAADLGMRVEVLTDAVALDVSDEGHMRPALTASLQGLAPLCRLIESRDLFQEEAVAYAAANAP